MLSRTRRRDGDEKKKKERPVGGIDDFIIINVVPISVYTWCTSSREIYMDLSGQWESKWDPQLITLTSVRSETRSKK
jgi:hypothetical protein